MQRPTVGRIVHYYNQHGEGPFAALIVQVYSADLTRLIYWDTLGAQHLVAEATNPGDPNHPISCWVWPPIVPVGEASK